MISSFSQIKNQFNSLKNQISSANSIDAIEKILTGNSESDFSSLFDQTKTPFTNLVQNLNNDYSADFLATLDGIKTRQIEKDPKLSLYKDQYAQILSALATLKANLKNQNTIGKRVFNDFKIVFDLQKEIKNLISSKINNLNNQISLLPTNTKLKQESDARTRLETRFSAIEKNFQTINQTEKCESNHGLLANILGENTSEVREVAYPECNDAESNTNTENNESQNHLTNQLNEIIEGETAFKSLFSPDSNNETIHIEGINATTYDRPIDSPRYLSFQGIGGNEIKLIYPNVFKIEAFNQNNQSLTLKTPEQFKKAIQDYIQNKVNEYNLLLTKEKNNALKESLHFAYLRNVDPLATPTLASNIRPYKPFTYQEMLTALGGEKMLNTLAYSLAYLNSPIQNRPFSDDISTDISLTKKAFDINQKI